VTVVPPVARVVVTPADTALAVGDTATFHAVAYGIDGQPLPAVPLALAAFEGHTSYPGSGPPALGEVYGLGTGAPGRVPNTIRVVARRAGVGWVRAAVVGRADSVRVRAVARSRPRATARRPGRPLADPELRDAGFRHATWWPLTLEPPAGRLVVHVRIA
jgi:hypothetical protein